MESLVLMSLYSAPIPTDSPKPGDFVGLWGTNTNFEKIGIGFTTVTQILGYNAASNVYLVEEIEGDWIGVAKTSQGWQGADPYTCINPNLFC